MVCINCGSTLHEGDRFCSRCGTRVTGERPAPERAGAVEAWDEALQWVPSCEDKSETDSMEAPETPEGEEGCGAGTETPEGEEGSGAEQETLKEEDGCGAGAEVWKRGGGADAVAAGDAIPLCIPEEKASKPKGSFRFCNGVATPVRQKRKPWVILGILAAAVFMLMANGAKIINVYHRNFTTPEEYYRWVERKTIKENAETISQYYVNYFVDYLHQYDSNVSSEIRVELGEAVRDRMELADSGPFWYERGTLTFESNNKDSKKQGVWGLEIGGEELLTMETIMDFKDQSAYLGIPELTKTYIGIDMDQRSFEKSYSYMSGLEPEEYLETLELLKILYKECPDRKQVEALANKYLDLLLSSIDDVRMRTGKTVRVGSIAQSCTTLELYFDEEDIKEILTEFLEELQEDEEIEELLVEIYDLAAELDLHILTFHDGREFYGAFQDKIDEMLYDLDYRISYRDEMEMTVYVDNKGQVIGRTVAFPNSHHEVSFSYVNPHRGSKFGYKGSIVADGEEVALTGSGRESGNKIRGNFILRYEGAGIVDIGVKDFDMKSLKKGYLNGEFTVTLASGIGRALDLASAAYLPDMQLIIDISMDKSSEKLSMELMEGKELWGSLVITSKRGNGRKISVPSTKKTVFVDEKQDLGDWWDTIQWDDFIKRMQKSGLPDGAIDTAREYREMGFDDFWDELEKSVWLLLYGFSRG